MESTRTKRFVGRLATSLAVFGSVFFLASASTDAFTTLLLGRELRAADEPVRQAVAQPDLFTPVEVRIQDRERMIAMLRDPVVKREENRKLAGLYEELGKRSFELNQLPRAEEAYQRSLALDPDNPKYLSDLAQLYAAGAVRQAEVRQKLTLYRNSSEFWRTAASKSPDSQQRRRYLDSAASSLFGAARELSQAGMIGEAREELVRARTLAPDGSEIARQIDLLIQQAR